MYVGDVEDGNLRLLHNTVCRVQIHVKDVEDTLYTVAPRPARREGSL